MEARSAGRAFAAAMVATFWFSSGLAGHSSAAVAASLTTGSGPRPGPDILYAPLATAPQLTNAGVWKVAPLLVSGATAYRNGEFLYQGFLYDDHGAAEVTDPLDQRTAGNAFSKPDGTYTYPTTAAYAH